VDHMARSAAPRRQQLAATSCTGSPSTAIVLRGPNPMSRVSVRCGTQWPCSHWPASSPLPQRRANVGPAVT
jgi:hypothetical protein